MSGLRICIIFNIDCGLRMGPNIGNSLRMGLILVAV